MKNFLFITAIFVVIGACNSRKFGTQVVSASSMQIDSLPSECPYLTKDSKGNTVLSWIRMISDSTTAFCYATSKGGKTFSPPIIIPNTSNVQPHSENLPKI